MNPERPENPADGCDWNVDARRRPGMNETTIFGKLIRFQSAISDVAVTNIRETLWIFRPSTF